MRENLTRLKGSIVNIMIKYDLDKPDIFKCNKVITFIDKILVGKIVDDIPAHILNMAKMLEYSGNNKLRKVGSIFRQMYEEGITG